MRIDFGSIHEKQAHDVRSAGARGVKERRPVLGIATIQVRPSMYEAFDLWEIPTLDRSNQFGVSRSHSVKA